MRVFSILYKLSCVICLAGFISIVRSAEISHSEFDGVSNTAGFVKLWANIIRGKLKSNSYRQVLSTPLELSLAKNLNVRDVYSECLKLLPKLYEEFSSNSWAILSKSVVVEICGLINPLNSEECLTLSVPDTQWALSLQTYAQARFGRMVDLRALCIMTSSIMPSRPFAKLGKRVIEKSCSSFCASKSGFETISQFDTSLCSKSAGLCEAMDFTQSSEFPSLSSEDFGICSAIAVIVGEKLPSLKLSYRDGCRFIQYWKGELGKSFHGFKSTEMERAFRKKFSDRLEGIRDLRSYAEVLSSINRDISSTIRTILESGTYKPKKSIAESEDSETSASLSDDESSSTMKIDYHKLKDLGRAAQGWASILYSKYHDLYSSDFSIKTFKSIARQISSRDTLQSCIDAVVGSSDLNVSYSVAKRICRYVDPYSYESCIHLRVFDLSYAERLRNSIQKYSEQIDLRDICRVVDNMNILDNARTNLQVSCENQLKRSEAKGKYRLSNSVISKVCKSVNFTSNFYYRNLSASGKKYLQFLVKNLSSEVSTLKVYMSVKGKLDLPSYEALVKMVDKVDDLESTDDCIDGLFSMLKQYKVYRKHNIENICEKLDILAVKYLRPDEYHYYPSTTTLRQPYLYRDYQPMLGFTTKGYYYFPDGSYCYYDGLRFLYKSKWYYRVGNVFYEDSMYIANIPNFDEPRYYYDGVHTFQIWQLAPGQIAPTVDPRIHNIVYRNGVWYHRGTNVVWDPTDIVHRPISGTNTTTGRPVFRFRSHSM